MDLFKALKLVTNEWNLSSYIGSSSYIGFRNNLFKREPNIGHVVGLI